MFDCPLSGTKRQADHFRPARIKCPIGVAIRLRSRTEPDRPDNDTSARAPVPRAMVVAVPSSIAVVAPAPIMPPVAMVSVAMAPVIAAAPISHQLDAGLVLAQNAKASRRRRCRCSRAADGSSQNQQTEKYEALHFQVSPSLIALPIRQNTRTHKMPTRVSVLRFQRNTPPFEGRPRRCWRTGFRWA